MRELVIVSESTTTHSHIQINTPHAQRRRRVYCRVYAFFESGSFSEHLTIAKRYKYFQKSVNRITYTKLVKKM